MPTYGRERHLVFPYVLFHFWPLQVTAESSSSPKPLLGCLAPSLSCSCFITSTQEMHGRPRSLWSLRNHGGSLSGYISPPFLLYSFCKIEGDGNLGCLWLHRFCLRNERHRSSHTLRAKPLEHLTVPTMPWDFHPGDIDGIKPSLLCLNVKAALLHMAFSPM